MEQIYKWLSDRTHQALLSVLAGGLLFRIVSACYLYPGFDEAYYYVYTLYPNLSYFDHPLLVALTTGLGVWLTGAVNQFTIRIGTLGLYTGSLILVYLTGARLFSRQAGFLAVVLTSIIPFFVVGFGILTLPDSPLMFFWTAALYVAAIEFFPQAGLADAPPPYRPSYRLALLGMLVGLACLGKYHGFILGVSLIGFCLTSPRHRIVFWSPWTGASLGLFGLTLAPLVQWNAQHDWISFTFQSARTVPSDRGFNLLDVLLVFLMYVAYLFPTIGFPLWWASWKALWSKRLRSVTGELGQKQDLLLWISLPLMVGFTLMGGYKQVLPSWPMPGFWSATLLLGHQASIWQQQSPRGVRRWLRGSAIAACSLALFGLSHVAFGIVQKPGNYALGGGFWAPKDDPSVQLLDVVQIRQRFAASPQLMAALEAADFMFTNRYFVGGQLAMALVPLAHKPMTTFDTDLRGFAYWSKPDEWVGKDGLYLTTELFQDGEDLMQKYGDYFDTIQKVADVPLQRGGSITAVVTVYQAQHLRKPYPRPYGNS
ncbi:4-amino-4-deoxy-L-arabinose transferase [Leptolyngbya sp. 'hensonii']|uniref:glycosyltransferase family 39 protein n=1 Tax=Leptolyngbya sp. 'hensonii' TaxID=1922337 RepID=UPI00094F8376|nr:glycosyltransferase family 39 protein [Leptolyngbya sp. 'hensonii']OLP19056.1 4-amino-4-deoxy-L-arabinose transferase [Leptolyngbya sp. 'hensonii']